MSAGGSSASGAPAQLGDAILQLRDALGGLSLSALLAQARTAAQALARDPASLRGSFRRDGLPLALLFGPHVLLVLAAARFLLGRGLELLWVLRRSTRYDLYKRCTAFALRCLVASVPGVSSMVAGAVQKELAPIEAEMHGDGDAEALVALPSEGWPSETVAAKCAALRGADKFITGEGKLWGGIYHDAASPLTELQGKVWAEYNTSNALYPKEFASLRKMEAEVISMTVGLVHGHEVGAVGLLASGGTEAVLLAALAYREHGRSLGIDKPQIVCGLSAHPAIVKACAYFGIELVKAPLDPVTMRLTPQAVRPLLTRRTVAIYASAPCFAFGAVDDIESLGKLAKAYGVGLHVDNCLGGFLLSFMEREGLWTSAWDFKVPGVTTISIDLHKYGYASKGASVCAFRDPALRRKTFVPSADGCEGLYVTPTLQGSRAGATIAVAWATLVNTGEAGYRESARALTAAQERIKAEVRNTEGIKLCGDPALAVVAISGEGGLSVYALATLLEKRGWGLFTGQRPASLAIPVGERTPHQMDELLGDLRECVAFLRDHPDTKPEGTAAVYGAAAAIPDAILEDIMRGYLDIKMKVKPLAASDGTRSSL